MRSVNNGRKNVDCDGKQRTGMWIMIKIRLAVISAAEGEEIWQNILVDVISEVLIQNV